MDSFFDTSARKRQTIKEVLAPSLLINILSLAIPLVVLQIYDRILPNEAYGTATLLLAGASVAIVLDAFLRFVRTWLLGAAATNTERSSYEILVHKLDSISFKQVRALHPGTLQEGFKGISQIKDFYSGGFVSGLIDVPFVLIFLGLVYYVGGNLVIIPIIVWAITATLVWVFSHRSNTHAQNAANTELDRSDLVVSIFSKIETIKAQANEAKIFHFFRKLNQKRWLASSEAERQTSIAQEAIQVAALGTSVAIVLVGSLDVLAGTLTTGGLAACSILSGRAVAPMSALMGLRLKYSTFKASNEAVSKLLNAIDHTESLSNRTYLEPLQKLQLDEVKISLLSTPYEYSFDVMPGDVVVLESDTLVNSYLLAAVAGVENVDSGLIAWNEVVLSEEAHNHLSQISAVVRQPQIVSGSLLDNLSGFDSNNNEAAQTIAKAIGLQRIIADLPNGVETKVGMQIGNNLSDGSIKLVAITAQLAKPTSLVLLDCPEQDLDLESISQLIKVIQYYSKNGRSFIINSRNPEILELATKRVSPSKVENNQ
ncbi:ABC transporter transmembrane domain-containing protein [Vibrio superstes]|uniref:Toxin ABC transporter n=1 Tax=Vibrio superstes NBRC 103154 TaxID=1219062 RepID=A0A511QVG6_9VIBR|nr:ABC transporter transmembrane domain-containing protein [Vibrio superstes]GEM81360.1 toxin ABC transporter [Vibrio superstes NBRC 103154]